MRFLLHGHYKAALQLNMQDKEASTLIRGHSSEGGRSAKRPGECVGGCLQDLNTQNYENPGKGTR